MRVQQSMYIDNEMRNTDAFKSRKLSHFESLQNERHHSSLVDDKLAKDQTKIVCISILDDWILSYQYSRIP